EPQVRERVLDLRALEEAQTSVHAVGNAGGQQCLFERTGLRVRAIKNGAIAPSAPVLRPLADAVDHEVGFVALVERHVELDGLTALAAGPQILTQATAVVADQRVGGIQDVAGRAIVLLESKQLRVRIVAAELL